MKIRIVNKSRHPLPAYHTEHAAAFDAQANIDEALVLQPMQRALIPTGLYIALPPGYEGQIRPRSGMAYKHGISIVNSPATIDADYRGEWKVLLINLGDEPYAVEDGDRIAQIVIVQVERAEWEEVDELDATGRHGGGFGHTGR
jgi:dUTP pyrophosphatase